MHILRRPLEVVWENRIAFLLINLVYFGLVGIFMVLVVFTPSIQEQLINGVVQEFGEGGSLEAVAQAYASGSVPLAALYTFMTNFFVGTFVTITLPSLVIPFSGLLMGACRATLWGLLLSPTSPALAAGMIPHFLTLLLEGEGYVIGLLAAYVHGKCVFFPRTVGAENGAQGYLEGLKRTGWLYILVAIILAAAAVYEAWEVIYIVPKLMPQPE